MSAIYAAAAIRLYIRTASLYILERERDLKLYIRARGALLHLHTYT